MSSGIDVKSISFDELDRNAEHYDETVARTKDVDRFCTSSFWILPAIRCLMPPSRSFVFRAACGYVALARSFRADATALLHPLEAVWGLACPLVGPEPEELVDVLLRCLALDDGWTFTLVSGVSEGSLVYQRLVSEARRRFDVSRGPETRRFFADLSRGVEGFLRRRSPSLRRNLRKAERRARARGLSFEAVASDDPTGAERTFERLLAVERRSWKGRRGVGIDREPMCSFYRDINRRLAARGARRLTFARIDDEDVGYIFGAVFGGTYRGLQFSFDQRFHELSLGNLCQLQEIRRLCETSVLHYDLGTEVGYKKRWGEEVFTTTALILRK